MVKDMREIKKIIVHCADTHEGPDERTAENKRWHTEELGWIDIGYHWVVELDGSLHAGRPEEVSGAHCKGHNSDSIGICYVGGSDASGNPKDTRTQEQKEALASLISDLLDRHTEAEVFGHRDFSEKACPSFDAKTEYAGL